MDRYSLNDRGLIGQLSRSRLRALPRYLGAAQSPVETPALGYIGGKKMIGRVCTLMQERQVNFYPTQLHAWQQRTASTPELVLHGKAICTGKTKTHQSGYSAPCLAAHRRPDLHSTMGRYQTFTPYSQQKASSLVQHYTHKAHHHRTDSKTGSGLERGKTKTSDAS